MKYIITIGLNPIPKLKVMGEKVNKMVFVVTHTSLTLIY